MVVGPGLPTPLTLESPAMKISTIARRLGGRSRTIHHDDVGIAAEGENSPYLKKIRSFMQLDSGSPTL